MSLAACPTAAWCRSYQAFRSAANCCLPRLCILLFPGNSCSSIGEERVHNPRLAKSQEEFVQIMDSLNLPYPAQFDKSVPANLKCGVF